LKHVSKRSSFFGFVAVKLDGEISVVGGETGEHNALGRDQGHHGAGDHFLKKS